MRRIATATKATDLFGPGKHGWRASNPATGLLATQNSPDFMNDVQETLLHPIEYAGLVAGPDQSLLTQAMLLISNIGVVTTLTASTVLTRAQRGLVLVNASAGNVTLTLPAADRLMDFMIKRLDNSSNKLTVQVSDPADEAVYHNTDINSSGYSFIRLYGAGDFWCLKCDGAGGWHPMARLNSAPIGSLTPLTGLQIPSGGFGKPNGTIYLRSDFPWLWDMAGVSGNLDTEANVAAGRTGAYSTGDTATTMRMVELRGEFIRVLDDSRGVDTGRVIGAHQDSQNLSHTHALKVAAEGMRSPADYSRVLYSTVATSPTGTTEAAGGGEARPRGHAFPHLVKLI